MLRRLGIAFIVAAVALGAIVGALAATAATPSHVDPISGLPAGTTIVGDLDPYDANAPPSQTDWAVIGALLFGLAAAGGVMIGSRRGNSDVRRLRIGFIVRAVVLGPGAGVVAARSGTRTFVARPHWPSAPTATSGNVGPNPGSTGDFITLQVPGTASRWSAPARPRSRRASSAGRCSASSRSAVSRSADDALTMGGDGLEPPTPCL